MYGTVDMKSNKAMILAVMNAIWATGFEPVTAQYWCDALTN